MRVSMPSWSDYTLPDNFTHRVEESDLTDSFQRLSPISGTSATTDPFDIESQHTPSSTEFLSGAGKGPKHGKVMDAGKSLNRTHSNNSGGFEFTSLEGDEDLMDPQESRPKKYSNEYHNSPNMGFFGVASPPVISKVTEWMSKEEMSHIPIRRTSSESSDPTTSPRSIPNSPRWIMIDGQCFSFSHKPGSIPNSPPQSPLYRRHSTRQKKVFEDINENAVFRTDVFLSGKKCYDLIPMSGKLIVFDKRLLVRKAFTALIANGTRAAPIWDSTAQEYTGMLTITDFISILHRCYENRDTREIDKIIEHQTIEEWKAVSEKTPLPGGLIAIEPTETVYNAAKLLLEKKIHRLPVIDPRSGNTLYIVTHKRILNFIYPILVESTLDPSYYCSIKELGIGTYESVKQLTYDSKLSEAMEFFAKTRVSAIPIVNSNREVVDIYARFDVITLASRRQYNNYDTTIKDLLQLRSSQSVDVLTCRPDDSLITVIKEIYTAQVHRLVVVNEHKHVVGLVSLSDLFRFLVCNTYEHINTDVVQDTYEHINTDSVLDSEVLQDIEFPNFEFG